MFLEFFTLVFGFFQKGLYSIGPFILLLGVLIFIHELGHFLAARYCNVKVEVFSLGFGPKILKYRKGETVYAISLFPLGGYVKMFGDDPTAQVSLDQQHRGFLYKTVPQKLLIAFGGPVMNLLFTLVTFFILGLLGTPALESTIGDIKVNTKAYERGLRSGDKILSINGEQVSYWDDVLRFVQDKPNQDLSFTVSKANSQNIQTYTIRSELKDNEDIFTTKKTIGFIEGLTALSKGTQMGVRFQSPAYKAGLRTFDRVKKINGQDIRYWRDLEHALLQKTQSKLTLLVQREDKDLEIHIGRAKTLKQLGIEDTALYIAKVGKGTPADKAGLIKGDRFLSIDGQLLKTWEDVLKLIQSFSGNKLTVEFLRDGNKKQIKLVPKIMYVEGHLKSKFMIGITSGESQVTSKEIIKTETILGSIVYSGTQTWHWLSVISINLYRLIQGKLSFRTLGGPIVIGRIAHRSFKTGLISFLFMMAIISLNLFFLNLLPIPMLDGGHILFFTIEGLMGRRLDVKKMIVAQQMGFFILMFFIVFTFLNDIYNWLTAW